MGNGTGYFKKWIAVLLLCVLTCVLGCAAAEEEIVLAYNVNIHAQPEEFGTCSGDGPYAPGTQVTVKAYPNDGFRFVGWYENDELVCSSAEYSFIIDRYRVLVPVFEQITYTIEAIPMPEEGGTVTGGGMYAIGETAVLTAQPAEGWQFDGWWMNGEDQFSTEHSIAFEAYENCNLQAKFTACQYRINIATNNAAAGLVVGGGMYDVGSSVRLTATAESYYVFRGWYDENGTLLSTDGVYIFTPERSCTVTAVFDPVTYHIAASAEPAEGGTVTGTGDYTRNTRVTLKAAANPGYTFSGWYSGTSRLTGSASYQFTAAADREFTAKFTINRYSVSATASGGYGNIAGTGTYTYGQQAELTAQPLTGYRFAGWYEGEILLSTEPGFSLLVDRYYTLEARFEPVIIADGDFIYRPYQGGEVALVLTGYTGSDAEVTVPKQYTDASGTCNIKYIDANVFAGKGIARINLPDNIVGMAENALAGCTAEIYATGGSYTSHTLAQMGLFHRVEGSADFEVNTPVKGNYSSDTVVQGKYTGSRTARSVTIPQAVTKLMDDCFAGMTLLETVRYDNYYKYLEIGDRAFQGCTALTRVEDDDRYGMGNVGQSAFEGCSALVTLKLGNGCKTIGANAFRGCSSLASLFLGSSVSTIDSSAFDGCSPAFYCDAGTTTASTLAAMGKSGAPISAPGLTITNYSNKGWTVTKFDGSVKDVVIPEGVETIQSNVFRAKSITSVQFPQSLKTIESNAFYDCVGLTAIQLPPLLETIGSNAFGYCSNVPSVEIPASVKTIDSSAFYRCLSLSAITLHEGLEKIGSNAFQNTAITSIQLPSTLKVLEGGVFNNTGVTTVHLPENMTSCSTGTSGIRFFVSRNSATAHVLAVKPDYSPKPFVDPEWPMFDLYYGINAYTGEHELNLYKYHGAADASVTVPDGVKTIYRSAFYPSGSAGNPVLETIVLPHSVTAIGDSAFRGLPNLKTVVLSDFITSFGTYIAYDDCPAKFFCSKDSLTAKNMTADVYPNGFTDPAEPDWSWCYENGSLSLAHYNGTAQVVSIPEEATAVGEWAFRNCHTVQEITVPSSVKSIGNYAFSTASGLKKVYLPDDIASLGMGLTGGSETVQLMCHKNSATASLITSRVNGSGFTDPDDPDYSWCYGDEGLVLTHYRGTQAEVAVPAGVVKIDSKAFYQCSTLQKVTLPEGLITIGDHAFQYCANLQEITFPTTLQRVESGAFNMATSSLKKLDLSATSLNYLGGNSLLCSLEEVWLPENVTTVDTYPVYDSVLIFCKKDSVTAYNISAENTGYRMCDPADPDWKWRYNENGGLLFGGYRGTQTELIVPDCYVGVANYAFSGAGNTIRKLVLPESITSLGYASLNGSFEELYLPNNITDINPNAMSYGFGGMMVVQRSSVTFANLCALGKSFAFRDPADPDWVWRYEEDGSLLLAGYRGKNTHLTLPIGAQGVHRSFAGNTPIKQSIVRVDVPQNITFIGTNAFLGFSSLKEVCLPDNVTLDTYPFEWMKYGSGPVLYCKKGSYTARNLNGSNYTYLFCDPGDPDWLWSYDAGGRLMVGGYIGNERIITLPSEASSVAPDSFWKGHDPQEWEGLTSITIPEGYTTIHERAFDSGCEYLKHISLPSTLKSIGEHAFWACDFAMLQLPEGLESIGREAFRACSGLQLLTIPTSVTSIPEPIIWDCYDLTTVVLHGGLHYIADDAFGDNLTDVYCYRGSYAAQWARDQGKVPALALHYIGSTTFDQNLTILGPNQHSPKNFARDAGSRAVWMDGISLSVQKPDETYTFTCTSSNPSVARVNGNTVEYLKPGTVTLTISLDGRKDVAPYKVEQQVFKPVESFTLPEVVFAQLGKDGWAEAWAPIEVYPADANPWFGWESIQNGKLWIDSSNETEIRKLEIGSMSGVVREILVVFYRQFNGLEAYAPGRELLAGEVYDPDITLTVDGSPLGNLNIYTITSSNPAVAVAADNHRIKAVGRGTATITVKEAHSGLKTSFTVRVDVREAMITPPNLKVIGPEAFAGIGAREVILYSECEEIQSRAFANCTSLERIEIPAGVTAIADDAFAGCSDDLVIITPPYSAARAFADAHGIQWEEMKQ